MLDLLHSLSVAGQELQAVGVSDDTSEKLAIVQRLQLDDDHITEATKLAKSTSPELWTQLQGQKVVMADVARAFGSIMALAPQPQALRAAAVYTTLLNCPGCPVLSLFDRIICSALLKLIHDVAFTRPAKGNKKGANTKTAAAPTVSAMEIDGDSEDDSMLPATTLSTETLSLEESIEIMAICVENFAVVLKSLALRDQPETGRCIAETFADVSSVPTLPSSARNAVFNALSALLSPNHGGIREMSAMVFKLLTPHMLGTLPGGKIATKDATTVRVAALNFVQTSLKNISGCEEAAAALMRHAVLKTPEKADGRAAAVETAVTLCRALGLGYLHCFVGFIVKLSRTSKANQRFMAVDLAAAFIEAFDNPFDPETAVPTHHGAAVLPCLLPAGIATALKLAGNGVNEVNNDRQGEEQHTGGAIPDQEQNTLLLRRGWISAEGDSLVPAPWGAVLLAVLHQRSSDKIPAVRARALHHLGSLASNTARAQDAAFIISLAAAETVDLTVAGNSGTTTTGNVKKKKSGTSSDDDEDGSPTAASGRKGTENTPQNASGEKTNADNEEEDEEKEQASGRPRSAAGNDGLNTALSGESIVLFRTLAFPVPAHLMFFGADAADATGCRAVAADLKPLLTMARLRCRDAKGQVRKSAVQLLQALIFIEAGRRARKEVDSTEAKSLPVHVLEPQDIAALEAAADDSLLTVRKAALLAAAQLAAALPWDGATAELWVSAGLPLIRDPESVIQDAVVDQVEELILARAAAVGAASTKSGARIAGKEKAEELRPILAAISRGGAAGRACLARTCAQLRAKNRLQAKKVTAGLEKMLVDFQQQHSNQEESMELPTAAAAEAEELEGQVENNNNLIISSATEDVISGTWILYAEIAAQAPSAPSWEFLQSQWSALTSNTRTTSSAQQSQHAAQLLRVIATTAAEFPADQATALCSQLRANLETLALPPAAAAAHVAALAQLTRTHQDGTSMAAWTASLFSLCESGLAAAVEALRCGCHHQDTGSSTSALAGAPSALFITGEVALLRASTPSSRLVTLVQALTSATLAAGLTAAAGGGGGGGGGDGVSSEQQLPMPTPRVNNNDEDEGGMAEEGEEEGATTAPAGTDTETLAPATTIASAAVASVPTTVQALAWVTLGKLCLVNESLAKKCVPLFVQELGRAASPAVRNNIMVALADLVINYTALVDSHIPRLAACLRDPNELVRTQALGLLANLLQKDYVKWRGPLFLRFMLALIDDSPRVAAMAEFLLTDALDSKLPNLAYNHFVEALFVLNDCQVGLAGGAAAAAAMADLPGAAAAEREAFCLKGSDPSMRAKRDAIYQALLRRMAPEHKFATSARLCQEVLGAAADGALPLSECSEVIGDALRVLSCKAIKVASTRISKDADLDPSDPQADAQAIAGAAKGRLVSQMMKKHLVEAVVPVIIELKRMMEALRHPLVADLMAAAAAMLKDHKTEIEDILAADRQLAKEILYDIKQAEAAEAARAAEEKEMAKNGAASGPSARQVPAAKTPGADTRLAKTPHTTNPHATIQAEVPIGNETATETALSPASQQRHTPRSAPQSRPPPGTSGSTPIARQVLRQATASTGPKSGLVAQHTKTPGSTRGRSESLGKHITPASGRGALATGGAGVSTGGRKLSRLARMSSGIPGSAPKTSGSGRLSIPLASPVTNNPSPAQPRLRPGREKIGASRLSKESKEEEEEEDHVELQFVVPPVIIRNEDGTDMVVEEQVSPKMWNISETVLPTTSSGGGGSRDVGGAREIERNEESIEEPDMDVDNDSNETLEVEETSRATRGRSRRTAVVEPLVEPKTRRKRKARVNSDFN